MSSRKKLFLRSLTVLFFFLSIFFYLRWHLSSPDDRFDRFTRQVFRDELSGNTLSLHYTLAHPQDFGFDTEPVSLGDASPAACAENVARLENALTSLKKFDRSRLSPRNQFTYDIFLDYLNMELDAAGYSLYSEPLSPTLGIQAQLPVLLAEYTFRTKGDIETYLTILSQIPDYFRSILAFEQAKSEAGLFMSEATALEIIRQCRDFIADPQNHYLIDTFNTRIDAITNLTLDEKIAYKNRNLTAFQGYLVPAYQSLITGIAAMENTGNGSGGLCTLPEGKSYYEYLVRRNVGDDRKIEEIEEIIKNQIVADFAATQTISAAISSSGLPAQEELPALYLNRLRQKMTDDFPLPPAVGFKIKHVPESLQQYLSPAFYLTPPIDDYTNNVIYINKMEEYTDLDLFTTLAHEGYPGHLYQNVYFNSKSPDLLRCILDTKGYSEGWATYVEMYSYTLWEQDPDHASEAQHNRAFTLGIASLLDIGIHYHGYSLDTVTQFLKQLGFSEDSASSLYAAILEAPANYLNYYVGYLNFCDLRDRFLAANPDKTLKDFHRKVLDLGPSPFYLLRQQMDS